jgi:hypothetical protein
MLKHRNTRDRATAGAALLGSARESAPERRLAMSRGAASPGRPPLPGGALPLPISLHLFESGRTPLARLRVRMNARSPMPVGRRWGLGGLRSAPDDRDFLPEDRVGEFLEPDGTPRLRARRTGVPCLSGPCAPARTTFILGIWRTPGHVLPGWIRRPIPGLTCWQDLPDSLSTTALQQERPAFLPGIRPHPHDLAAAVHPRAFVSKVDLRHMARNSAGMRPEVVRELERYLATLKG